MNFEKWLTLVPAAMLLLAPGLSMRDASASSITYDFTAHLVYSESGIGPISGTLTYNPDLPLVRTSGSPSGVTESDYRGTSVSMTLTIGNQTVVFDSPTNIQVASIPERNLPFVFEMYFTSASGDNAEITFEPTAIFRTINSRPRSNFPNTREQST